MKILHIVQVLSPGGIEQFVLTLLKADFDNTYILALEGTFDVAIKSWPILAEVESHLVFADIRNLGKKEVIRLIRKTCVRHSITVLHSHFSAPLLYACLGSFGKKNLIHVHTEHDAWHLNQWKPRLIERTLFLLKKDIRLVAVSSQIQNALKNYFPKRKSTLIHNAIDTELFKPGDKRLTRQHFNLPSSAIIIGSAGRLCDEKGHKFLIEAMKYLPDKVHLVIAGEGPLHESLLAQIQTLNLNRRVQLLGLVTRMDLFYQACDIFCLPSLHEGLPLTLLEAQSTNLPSVCSDVGSCSEGVDPLSGILVKSEDSVGIAKACLSVYEKKGTPRHFILKSFSLDPLKEKYMQLYSGGPNDIDR